MAKITLENYKTAELDDYHHDFATIWERDFSERSVLDLWLHVVDHISRIARAIRKQEPAAVIDDIADSFVWLFSFISYCQNQSPGSAETWIHIPHEPSEIIWRKYPRMCPGCFDASILERLDHHSDEAPGRQLVRVFDDLKHLISQQSDVEHPLLECGCLAKLTSRRKLREMATGLRPELDQLRLFYAELAIAKRRALRKVSDIEEMFLGIYGSAIHIMTVETIIFHLLEEVGEASEAIKDLFTFDSSREPFTDKLFNIRKERLLEEIADIFSWLFAVSIKIRETYFSEAEAYKMSIMRQAPPSPTATIGINQIIWSKYGMTGFGGNWDQLKCPGCKNAPCACPRDIRFVPAARATIIHGRPNNGYLEPKTEARPERAGAEGQRGIRDLIFVSYCQIDFEWLERLQKMLRPLVRNKTLALWDDTMIRPGQRWRAEIDSALNRARVAVLLVSSDFLASDFVAESELPPLLERSQNGQLRIVWIPIKHCLYAHTEIGKYQAAHDPSRPLDSLVRSEQDAALVKICEMINEA
jgi:NTP pyrophosphatase (non-canonical NTP hydrolase)